MVTKVGILRKQYFMDKMNVVDFLLACLSIVEVWVLPIALSDVPNLRQLTLLRVLRLTRIIRAVKIVAGSRQIIMVVEGLWASLESMLSIGVLLLFAIFVLAIVSTEMIGRADVADPPPDQQLYEEFDRQLMFGTVMRSSFTLFSLMLLQEWVVLRVIWETQSWLMPFFLVFLSLSTLGVMNVIIGVIVDRTSIASQKIKDDDNAEKLMRQLHLVKHLVELLFRGKPVGHALSKEELMDVVTEAEEDFEAAMGEINAHVELPLGFTVSDIHTMLDMDGDSCLTEDEMILGMHRLFRSSPIQTESLAQRSHSQLKQKIYRLENTLMNEIASLRELLEKSALRSQEASHSPGHSHPTKANGNSSLAVNP
jgi:hypothetical protein